jgi:hypothetical protein
LIARENAPSATFSSALSPSHSLTPLLSPLSLNYQHQQEDAHAVSLRVPSSKKAAAAASKKDDDDKGKKKREEATDKKDDDDDDDDGVKKPENDDEENEKGENSDSDSIPTAFFAVFDGHGGKEVAKYAAEHMVEEVAAAPQLRAARKLASASASAASSADAPAADDDETTKASSEAPLPQSGPLPDAASRPARLLAAALERAYLSTDVRVCAPDARRELAVFAAGGGRGGDGSAGA